MLNNNTEDKHIVILGGGFAGLWAAKELGKKEGYRITLIDRNNYHIFQPLLYQVASAGLEPEQIIYPLRGTFRKMQNLDFRMAEVSGVDLEKKVLSTDVGPIEYDGLVVALGSVTNYFGVPGASEFAFPLKSAEEAIDIRNHILSCFEYAQYEPDLDVRNQLLSFTIVGGGPTGVEYAGALAELVSTSLRRDFRMLKKQDVHITLIEGHPAPLFGYPDKLRNYAKDRLEKLGVNCVFGSHVVKVEADKVTLKDGTVLPTRTVLWTGGIRGNSLAEDMDVPLGHADRIVVEPSLNLIDYPEVFIAGDLALPMDGETPVEAPTIAPNAIQQGQHAAQNLIRYFENEKLEPYKYFDKGSLSTIGRSSAVAQLGKIKATGFLAWVLWLIVHLLYLIGFRNRVIVLINWTWEYFLFERGVRLILPKVKDTIPYDKADEYDNSGSEGAAFNAHSAKDE